MSIVYDLSEASGIMTNDSVVKTRFVAQDKMYPRIELVKESGYTYGARDILLVELDEICASWLKERGLIEDI